MALVLALSICSQTVAILNFPGTNDFAGMVALYGLAAYSLIEAGVNSFDRVLVVLRTPGKFPFPAPDCPCAHADGRDV